MWGCTDVLDRTFPLQQLSLCFMVFLCFVCFFENERRVGDTIFMIFFFFLLFIASDRAALLHLPFFTVPHYFFFFNALCLVFDLGPF